VTVPTTALNSKDLGNSNESGKGKDWSEKYWCKSAKVSKRSMISPLD
jgi:hypothetical protein